MTTSNADSATGITATGDCGDTTTKVAASAEDVVSLCMFAAPLAVAQTFERTARYASDPRRYLTDAIGEESMTRRNHLLSLPATVDKDIYGNGAHKSGFQRHIARLLGKRHGLFFVTGVQAQLTALRIHCDRAGNRRVAWHASCHLETAEERSFEALYGLQRVLLGTDPRELPTVEEILAVVDQPADRRPAALLLEIPNRMLGCTTYSYDQLERISSACRKADVAFHCDGARLWEIEPYYSATAGRSFKQLGELFDSLYVSFYKGLGGIAGAMLTSDDASFMAEAQKWQRRAGGNVVTLTYEVADCERGFNENMGTFERKWRKMAEVVEHIQTATAGFKDQNGEFIIEFWPSKPTCCQIRTIFHGYSADDLLAARNRAQEKTGIRVFERLWPAFSLDEKLDANRRGRTDEELMRSTPETLRHEIEWMIMSVTEKVETRVFVEGYVTFCKELTEADTAVKGK